MRRGLVAALALLMVVAAAGVQYVLVSGARNEEQPTAVVAVGGLWPSPTPEPVVIARAPLGLPTPLALLATPTATATPTITPVPPTPSPTRTPTPVGPTKTGGAEFPRVTAPYAVVIDERSGHVLFDRNARQRVAPASLTKIVTAIVAIERGNPHDQVRAGFDTRELVESTIMGLHVGDVLSLEDLLYGLMLPSGNDAALAIANHIAGSKPRFVEMMNQRARDLGLTDTQFKNPHGLDEDGHYTSPYDIAMLARHGMTRQPLFVKLASARWWEVKSSRGSWEIYNMNKLLASYRGADGVKIGYTDAAGRAIVASATRDGHRVYVALMRSGDLWGDAAALLDYVFANYAWP